MSNLCALLFSTATVVGNTTDPPKTVGDYFYAGNNAYVALVSPDALQPEDVDRWARLLNMSEAQHEFMRIMYAEFVKHHNELMDHEAPKYVALSAEAGRIRVSGWKTGGLPPAELADAYANCLKASKHLQAELERVENDYIDSLLPVLADEQADRVYVLRNEASRRQSRVVPLMTRWSNVDLRLIWELVDPQVVTPADSEAMMTILDDYEARITPLLRRVANLELASGLEGARSGAQLARGIIDENTYVEANRARWKKLGALRIRVREVTEQTVKTAAELLSPRAGAIFVTEAKTAAFPELYPDRTALEPLFHNLLKDVEIGDKTREAVEAMRLDYVERYKGVCRELEGFCVEWNDRGASGEPGYPTQFLRQNLQPLLEKRQVLSDATLAKLKEMTSEQIVMANMPESPKMERTPQQLKAIEAGQLKLKNPPGEPQPLPGAQRILPPDKENN